MTREEKCYIEEGKEASKATSDFLKAYKKGQQDLLPKVKQTIETEFPKYEHICECEKWCDCWEKFWQELKAKVKGGKNDSFK